MNVVLNVLRMGAAVNEYFLDAIGSEELEGVLNHRNVDQGEETLNNQLATSRN